MRRIIKSTPVRLRGIPEQPKPGKSTAEGVLLPKRLPTQFELTHSAVFIGQMIIPTGPEA